LIYNGYIKTKGVGVMLKANQFFIYLFRIKGTDEVIYVGSTKSFTNRFNDHRRSMRESERRAPIHKYMIENGLDFGKNIEVVITEFLEDTTKEQALKVEAEYFYKYRETLKNTRPAEDREGEFSVRNKAVKCLNDNKVFISVRKAAEHYKISRYMLSNHLNKGSKMLNGMVFEYINHENVDKKIYSVKCIEDEKEFATLKGCADFYRLPYSNFTRELKQNGIYKRDGKTFATCND
jgi:predicted GIY-YIG superfamily endonuclease